MPLNGVLVTVVQKVPRPSESWGSVPKLRFAAMVFCVQRRSLRCIGGVRRYPRESGSGTLRVVDHADWRSTDPLPPLVRASGTATHYHANWIVPY